MLLLHEVRIALVILLATCSTTVWCQSSSSSGVSTTPAESSASATTSTGTDGSSAALTTTASSSSLASSSDGTSASTSVTSQIASTTMSTTSSDSTSNSVESTPTSITSSTTPSDQPQSTAPSTTITNGTTMPDEKRPPPCTNPTAPFAPFCEPTNGREVLINETVTVRWSPSYYPVNSTIILGFDYTDSPPNDKKEAWRSNRTQNSLGFMHVPMNETWLRNQPQSNLTLWITQMDPTPNERATTHTGPTLTLSRNQTTDPTPKPAEPKNNTRLGVLIGLPVALAVIALIVLGLLLGKRRTRKLGVGSVMGRRGRGRGYGVGQSRRQRMRGRGLDDDVGDGTYSGGGGVTDEGFRDEPTRGGVELDERPPGRSVRLAGSDSLGSLDDDNSIEERYRDDNTGVVGGGRRGGENAFRQEVERQQRGRQF